MKKSVQTRFFQLYLVIFLMQHSIGALSVDLRLLSAKFDKGVSDVNGKLNGLSKQASRVNKVFGSLLAVGGTAAFTGLIKGSLDSANRLGDLSTRLGTSVEGLSRLEYAAKLTGVSQNTLAAGLQRATRRISEAAMGSGEAVNALDELGLSAVKLNQLRPEQQFEVLADALEKVPKQSDKVRLGMKLLDSEGVALLQTMKGGSAAIREMGEESDRTGNTVTKELAASSTAANAAMIKFNATMLGITNTVIASLGPSLQESANWLSGVLPEALSFSSRAFNGLRATIAFVAARFVELSRVVTYTVGIFSDDVADMDAVLAGIQESLDETAGGFADKVFETASEQKKFNVAIGDTNLKLQDFQGRTESTTQALKVQSEATKAVAQAEKKRQEIKSNFDGVRRSLRSETEAEREEHATRLAQIEEFRQLSAENEIAAFYAKEAEVVRHEQALTEIEKTESEKRKAIADQEKQARMGIVSGMFSNLSTLMNTKSKKMFEIGKKAALASAIVSGLTAVVHSYKAGAEIGGPVLGAAFAATAGLATGAQIQKIESQKFGGGASVTSGTSGGSAPGVYQPPQPLIPSGPQSENSRAPQIIFNGPVNGIDAQHLVETLEDHFRSTDYVFGSFYG